MNNYSLTSEQCWDVLTRYWVLPPPMGYIPRMGERVHDGFCVVCGEWVPKVDPEGSMCPKRYILPHADILPFVVEALKASDPSGDDGSYTVGDVQAASKKGRAAYYESKENDDGQHDQAPQDR